MRVGRGELLGDRMGREVGGVNPTIREDLATKSKNGGAIQGGV